MALSYRDVAEILKVVDSSSLDELVLELGEAKLVVRRGAAGAAPAQAPAPAQQAPAAPRPAPAAAAPAAAPGRAAPAPAAAPVEGAEPVPSPMVGRAFRRPTPEEAPYVEVGARVAAGDTVCLIEVMKLFTAIESPVSGTVAAIAFEDGAAVEYDQPLIWITPD